MKKRDEQFRKWYDERTGTKSEGFAYDVWCAAWGEATWQATKPKQCMCEHIELCNLHDKCMKGQQ